MLMFEKQSKLSAGFLQCNSGKLEKAEDFKCGFVVVCSN